MLAAILISGYADRSPQEVTGRIWLDMYPNRTKTAGAARGHQSAPPHSAAFVTSGSTKIQGA